MAIAKVIRKVAKKHGGKVAKKVAKNLKDKKKKIAKARFAKDPKLRGQDFEIDDSSRLLMRQTLREAAKSADKKVRKDLPKTKGEALKKLVDKSRPVSKAKPGSEAFHKFPRTPREFTEIMQKIDPKLRRGYKTANYDPRLYLDRDIRKKGTPMKLSDVKKVMQETAKKKPMKKKPVKKDGKTIDTKVVRKVDSKKLLKEMEQAKATGKRAEVEKLLKKLEDMKSAQKVLLRKLQQKKRAAYERAERKANIKTIKSTATEHGIRAAKAASYEEAKKKAEERKKAVAARRKKKK